MLRCSLIALALLSFLEIAPADEPDYEALIALRSSSGFKAALAAAEERLAADPRNGTALAVKALVFGNGVDFLAMAGDEARERSEEALRSALLVAPDAPFTLAALGLVRRGTDPTAAEESLKRCVAEHPDFLECHNLYGDLLRKSDRQALAGQVYLGALERWPEDGELRVSYALHLQETGRAARAESVLRQLVRDRPDFPRGHWHLATLLYETGGDRSDARREAERALALDPLIWNGDRLLRLLAEPGR